MSQQNERIIPGQEGFTIPAPCPPKPSTPSNPKPQPSQQPTPNPSPQKK